jgi:hypothetical protein
LFLLSVIQTPKELTVSILIDKLMASSVRCIHLAYKVKSTYVMPIYLFNKPTAYLVRFNNIEFINTLL